MKTIHKILNLYLNKKLENQTIDFLLNLSFVFILHLVILIMIEQNAFLIPETKTKILNMLLIVASCSVIFIILKILIHKHNSDKQQLAKELINKLPTKDRIINALQIYSKLDKKSPYSDLTIKAIDDLEGEIKTLSIKSIAFKSYTQKLYLLLYTVYHI